jgi:hypothetical protein
MQIISLFFIFIMAAIIIFPPLSVAYFARYPLPQKAKKRADKRQRISHSAKLTKKQLIKNNPIFRTPKTPKRCSRLLITF